MTIDTYMNRVVAYLRSGKASEAAWKAVGEALNEVSEGESGIEILGAFEEEVFGKRVECPVCGSLVLPGVCCWGCQEWTAPEGPAREAGEYAFKLIDALAAGAEGKES